MVPTGERFIPGQSGQIEIEHLNRYYFVILQVSLKDKVVVDLASGEGYGSDLMSKFAKKVFGIDLSQEAIEHSKQKYKRNNLEFIKGDAAQVPLPDKTADIFVSFETIEHHDKHTEMIEEIKRVLKPEGLLIISTPDKYNYSEKSGTNNEFHIKELYNEDFKNILRSFFKNTVFFSQRVFIGSIIALEEGFVPYMKPIIIDKNGNPTVFPATYNIAIASDRKDLTLKYPIISQSGEDELYELESIKFYYNKIMNSRGHKLMEFILIRYRQIKRYLRKIFKRISISFKS